MNPAAQWYFESLTLYKNLCDGETSAFSLIELMKNQIVYKPNDPSDRIYFVRKGRIKVHYYSENNIEVVKAILSTGEIFGEMALAGEGKRSEYAEALDKINIIYTCPLSKMQEIIERNSEVSLSLVKLMGLRMMKLERKVELVVLKDARHRVIEFLRDAAEWKGKKVGSETLIETPLTHHDLAKLTGLSRQMLTGTLNDLKRENLIYFDRRRILIRDLSHFH